MFSEAIVRGAFLRASLRGVLGVALGLALPSCDFRGLKKDLKRADNHPSIQVRVDVENWTGLPLVVGLLDVSADSSLPDTPAAKAPMEKPGVHEFFVKPGQYRVLAYEDTNANYIWEQGERVGAYKAFEPVEIKEGKKPSVAVEITDVMPAIVNPIAAGDPNQKWQRVGVVTEIDDSRFGAAFGPLGMWTPLTFLEQPGAGLFFLQPFEPGKTPVVFIHGMVGYPQEFKTLIDGLDRERFQPWVFQYPSGLSLETLANGLAFDLNELARRFEYGSEVCIVAHSMGGVLSHLFIDKHREEAARQVRALVTIVSPLGGMPSAAAGAKWAPVVVPSWRDLDPNGETIRHLLERDLPEDLRYALFFGHIPAEPGSDGTVALISQLIPRAMEAADEVVGFSAGHAEILRKERTSKELNRVLADLCVTKQAGLTSM